MAEFRVIEDGEGQESISWNILRLFLKRAVIVSDFFSFVAHTNLSFLSTQSGGDVFFCLFVCLFVSLGPWDLEQISLLLFRYSGHI